MNSSNARKYADCGKDIVLAAEREPIQAKGFARPVRNYKVLERIDDMVEHGKAIREEQDGLRILLGLLCFISH